MAGPGYEDGGAEQQHGPHEAHLHQRDLHREHRGRPRCQGRVAVVVFKTSQFVGFIKEIFSTLL